MIADIWRNQPASPQIAQPISIALLEHHVYAKPYFEPEGLVVARENGTPIGFVHVGFGPTEKRDRLNMEAGVVSRLMATQSDKRNVVLEELLLAGEDFLRKRGAKTIDVVGVFPACPFYLGFTGGCSPAGLAESETSEATFFQTLGYSKKNTFDYYRIRPAELKTPMDRPSVQRRRVTELRLDYDPTPTSWWDSCLWSLHERLAFRLATKRDTHPVLTAWFWDMQPLAASWGVRAVGMSEFEESSEAAPEDLALTLGDSLKYMFSQGVATVELRAESGSRLDGILQSLGATKHEHSAAYQKATA